MYITLETDYAIRIVDCIARSNERIGAQAIADSTGVTLRFSLKILRKLVQREILKSYKGVNGGYELCCDLKDISLYDILETIEGPYSFSRCLREEHFCPRNTDNTPCPYHMFFDELSEEVSVKLKSSTMDKFVTL